MIEPREHQYWGMWLHELMTIAQDVDGLSIDLRGGSIAAVSEPSKTASGNTVSAIVDTDIGAHKLDVATDSSGRWRVPRIQGPTRNPDPAFAPLSGGPKHFALPAASQVCLDGIVRWDCSDDGTSLGLQDADIEAIAQLRLEAERDPELAGPNAVRIERIRASSRDTIWGACALMQGATLSEPTLEALAIDSHLADKLAAEVCPGDPSMLTRLK